MTPTRRDGLVAVVTALLVALVMALAGQAGVTLDREEVSVVVGDVVDDVVPEAGTEAAPDGP